MIPSQWKHHKHWSVYGIVLEPNEREFLIKIGYSNDPITRLGSMMTAMPYPPSLIQTPKLTRGYAVSLEESMHRAFKKNNTRGEWFLFGMDDKRWFNSESRRLWAEVSEDDFGWIGLGPKRTQEEVNKAAAKPWKRKLERAANF